MRQLTLPLFLIATLAGCGTAMAFNCEGITLPSNVVICSDPDLTRLADERQQIYNETRSRLTPEQQAALWEDQKAWVRSYATACGIPPDQPPAIPAPPSVLECFKRSAESRADYLRAYGLSGGAASTSPGQRSTTPSQVQASDISEVALVPKGQVFEIPVQINGAITLPFIIDSGASDVQITLDVFSTLVRAKTIVEDDIIGEQTYVLADGTKQKNPRFLLRELKVGNRVIRNVAASVGSPSGDLLLGQSFLSHFDSWSLDNRRHVLALVGSPTGTANQSAPEASTTAQTRPMASIAVPAPRNPQPSAQSAVVCGRPVEYAIDQSGISTGLLGVWTGNWNNASRLCGAIIVQSIDSAGAADVIYVYGSNRSGSGLAWKQQRRSGILRNGVLSFQDDQGSAFKFSSAGLDSLDASFVSGSGHLIGTFQKSH